MQPFDEFVFTRWILMAAEVLGLLTMLVSFFMILALAFGFFRVFMFGDSIENARSCGSCRDCKFRVAEEETTVDLDPNPNPYAAPPCGN